MPHPGVTRPDLCSIRAAAGQAEPAGAACGGLSADSRPPAGYYPPAPLASGIDRAIRLSTAAAVLAAAGIAAYVSYWHAYAVVRAHGETGITARLEPATIEGLVYASSMVVLYAARHRLPVPSLARWLLALGIAATLTANMAQGWSHGPVGAVVAAWPAVSLVGSYELLVWLIRTSGAEDREPSAEHLCTGVVCRAAVHPVPASAVDGEPARGSERGMSGPAWRPAGQAAGQSPIPASGQRDDEALEASAVNDAAVAAYRLSVQAGNPLSERRPAQMFGRTSRRWARARIADARQTSPLPDSPSTLVPACVGGLGRSAGQALLTQVPATRILVLTSYDEDRLVYAALWADAQGYELKSATSEEIVRAVHTVAHGDGLFAGGVVERMSRHLATGGRASGPSAFPELTQREREILELMAQGHSNAYIGDHFVLNLNTVRNHVSAVLAKLGVSTRAEAVVQARQAGLGGQTAAGRPPIMRLQPPVWNS